MATSQNGWPAGSRQVADVATYAVPRHPNVKLPVNRLAAPALLAMARWWFDHVERPVVPGCWGWADRKIVGSTTQVSNHASGTAIDLNAPRHPLARRGTVPARLRGPIAVQAAKLGLRWGGTYSGRVDEMHFEVIVSAARMREIVAKLQGRPSGQSGGRPAGQHPVLQQGSSGQAVRDLQSLLKRVYPAYAGSLVVDGEFGPATKRTVVEFQRRAGLAMDGVVGPRTWIALGF